MNKDEIRIRRNDRLRNDYAIAIFMMRSFVGIVCLLDLKTYYTIDTNSLFLYLWHLHLYVRI